MIGVHTMTAYVWLLTHRLGPRCVHTIQPEQNSDMPDVELDIARIVAITKNEIYSPWIIPMDQM